jgi:voltage-gated potassium channel
MPIIKSVRIFKQVIHFYKVIYKYITSVSFITVAVSALALITFNAWLFWQAEMNLNPKVTDFFDCIYWSITTSTTVGYGDTSPTTTMGKIVSMFSMISGALMFAIFTGLFAQTLYQDEEIKELFKD